MLTGSIKPNFLMLAISSSFFKISRYTSLVIILYKILITPYSLLDIQIHTITECFLNITVGIGFLFSGANCQRLMQNSLRSIMIIQHYFRLIWDNNIIPVLGRKWNVNGSKSLFYILCWWQGFFPSHSWRIFVFFNNISDGFMGNM